MITDDAPLHLHSPLRYAHHVTPLSPFTRHCGGVHYGMPPLPFLVRHCGLDPQSPATKCEQKEELPY
ncbi:MAG: hypothetical protein ACRC3G_06190 [Bacteroidales bacterium]